MTVSSAEKHYSIAHHFDRERHSMAAQPELTVALCTRNRPEVCIPCLQSLRFLDGVEYEVLVMDDASDPPMEPQVRPHLGRLHCQPDDVPSPRNEHGAGDRPQRTQPRVASAPYILSLDDDAELVDAGAVTALRDDASRRGNRSDCSCPGARGRPALRTLHAACPGGLLLPDPILRRLRPTSADGCVRPPRRIHTNC